MSSSKLASINGEALLRDQLHTIRSILNLTGRQKTFRTYQLLPRHRRRRIMSWSVRCIPRSFKKTSISESLAPRPKISRKARRRRLLCRIRVFFSKRFAIRMRCGVRMPVRSNQSQLRYSERLLLTGASCYCNLQQEYGIFWLLTETNNEVPSTIYCKLIQLRESESSALVYLEDVIPVYISYLNDRQNGVSSSRYLLSYNSLDKELIRRWFPGIESLPDFVHLTLIARQASPNQSTCDAKSSVDRISAILSRRIWSVKEYCGIRAATNLSSRDRFYNCYPNASDTLFTELHEESCSNYFIRGLLKDHPANLVLLRAHKISKLNLPPLGEPPEWRHGCRNALKYKIQNSSLELFDERTLMQLTREMASYLNNDTIRKLRVMNLTGVDMRRDPNELVSKVRGQESIDEGEIIDDDEIIPPKSDESVKALIHARSEPIHLPHHVDACSLNGFPLGCSPQNIQERDMHTLIAFHPICQNTQFTTLSFAVQKDEVQPLLLGLLRDGILILGEEELKVTMCNLAQVPFIPTTLAPSVLYYNLSDILDDFIIWTKLPWTKRPKHYTSRSILYYIVQILEDAELREQYFTSSIAICFDLVLETVSQELYSHYYPLRKTSQKQVLSNFIHWITTAASDLSPAGFVSSASQRKKLSELIDISATIKRMKDFVEIMPTRAPELENILFSIAQRTKIVCLSTLHKYPYGHRLKLKPVTDASAETLDSIVIQSRYSSILGRCLSIVILVFPKEHQSWRDSLLNSLPDEFLMDCEPFTSRVHWF